MKRFSSITGLIAAGALLTLAGAAIPASAAPFVQTAPGVYAVGNGNSWNDVYAGARALNDYRNLGVQIIGPRSCYMAPGRSVMNGDATVRYRDRVKITQVSEKVWVKVTDGVLQRGVSFG